jgi:Protein of unknown function (DUF3137)
MAIDKLETQRLNLVKIAKYNLIIRIILAAVIFGLCLATNQSLVFGLLAYVPLYGFTLTWFQYYYVRFRMSFKRDVINNLILQGSETAAYLPNKFIDSTFFDKCQLFDSDHDWYNGEDLVEFNEFGNLKISELNVTKQEEYRDSKGTAQTRTVIVFQGLFAVATFPFQFEGVTHVYANNHFFKSSNKQNVILESPRFMEIWSVRSTSQVGARLALGTDIMNNLLYFKEKLGSRNLSMSFVSNQVFIAIDQNSFLEPDYKISVLEQESAKVLKEELDIIRNIIETFKLRQNIH